MSFLACFPCWFFVGFSENLSSDSFFCNKSLNLGGFVESLISFFQFSSDNVLSYIVLFSQSKSCSDVIGSLWSESSWSLSISESSNFLWSFFNDFKGNNCKIWSADTSSYRLSFSLSGSSWSVQSCSYKFNFILESIIFLSSKILIKNAKLILIKIRH